MKKLFMFLFVSTLILFSFNALAYTVLQPAPGEVVPWIQWLMSEVGSVKGQGWPLMVALGLWALVGVTKFTFLKKYFDKLGKYKFLVPLLGGALAEVFFNLPQPFSFSALIAMFVAGAGQQGLLAVAFHHLIDKFKEA